LVTPILPRHYKMLVVVVVIVIGFFNHILSIFDDLGQSN